MISRVSPVNFKSTIVKTPLFEATLKAYANKEIDNDNSAKDAKLFIAAYEGIKNDGTDDIIEFKQYDEKKLFKSEPRCGVYINGELKELYKINRANAALVQLALDRNVRFKGDYFIDGEMEYKVACIRRNNALERYAAGLKQKINEIKESLK